MKIYLQKCYLDNNRKSVGEITHHDKHGDIKDCYAHDDRIKSPLDWLNKPFLKCAVLEHNIYRLISKIIHECSRYCKETKKETHTTLHHEERVIFEACIANRTNVIVCGGSGVGKTTFVQSVLDDMNSLEVTFETIKKLDLIEGTAIHLFLDDYDGEFKSIVERVSDGKSPTRGSFVLTTKAYTILPHFHTIFL